MKILRKYILALTCILAAACQKNVPADGGHEPASLTFTVALPTVSVGTKAHEVYHGVSGKKVVSDPFSSDLSGWTDFEKLIDARVIYRLTMFLVDRVDGVLVGYRDLYYKGNGEVEDSPDICPAESEHGRNGLSADGTEAVVTFDYDHPLHVFDDKSSLEKLERGEYRMIIVANWSPVTITAYDVNGNEHTGLYAGLKDKNGKFFGDYVKSVLDTYRTQTVAKPKRFSRKSDSAGSEYTDYHNLMDFALYSCDKHFLCAFNPQPLVLVQDFELQPGKNKISGQLKRTWARLRVSVENLSDKELTVNDLSFGANTTRDESFLFYAPGNEAMTLTDPHESTAYGAPAISNTDGIESDHPDTYNAWVSFGSKSKISPVGSASGENRVVLFDGYILDCNGKGNPFTYDLDLAYEGKEISKLKRIKNSDGTWKMIKSDLSQLEDGGLYIFWNQEQDKRFLYAGDGRVETKAAASGSKEYFDFSEVFRLVAERDDAGNVKTETVTNKYGDNPGKQQAYPIYNLQAYSGKYVGVPYSHDGASYNRHGNITLDKDKKTTFVVRTDGQRESHKDYRYFSFWSTVADEDGVRKFINVHGKSQDRVGGWSDNDGGSDFWLYPVEQVKEGASYKGTVTLSTVDPETAVVSDLTAIHRNDFINILVTVSYNDISGEFEFVVKDWNAGSGEIDFN